MKKVYIICCNNFPIFVSGSYRKTMKQYNQLKDGIQSGKEYSLDHQIKTTDFVSMGHGFGFTAIVSDVQKDVYTYSERFLNDGIFANIK